MEPLVRDAECQPVFHSKEYVVFERAKMMESNLRSITPPGMIEEGREF